MYPLQSEHIGTNIFDLILNEDHKDVKDAMKNSEIDSMSGLKGMQVYYSNTTGPLYVHSCIHVCSCNIQCNVVIYAS